MTLPSHDDVRAAATRIAPHIVRTPMLRHRLLDEMTGGTILVKPEPLQRTGSFKLRGATNAALKLDAAQRKAGVVTHSSGNHGQATACAAAMLGMPALIAMPADAPSIKVESTRRWGAEITFFDRKTTDREADARFARRLHRRRWADRRLRAGGRGRIARDAHLRRGAGRLGRHEAQPGGRGAHRQ
jgi:threonine dehydratase